MARKDPRLSRFTASVVELDLLVVDALGFTPTDQEGAHLLFQLIGDLYARVSIMVTSTLRCADWNEVLAEKTMTAAVIDRLTYTGHVLESVGASCCFHPQHSQEAQERKHGKTEVG